MAHEVEDAAVQQAMAQVGARFVADGIVIQGFEVTSTKASMLAAADYPALQEKLAAPKLPLMIFPRNRLTLYHKLSGLSLTFGAEEALAEWVAAKNEVLEVSAAQDWAKTRNLENMTKVEFDWTFSSPFIGKLYNDQGTTLVGEHQWTDCSDRLDMNLLKARDPILYYDEMVLYEDELDDNGVSVVSLKVRVMPRCWYILFRSWLRVDRVVLKLREARYCCAFQAEGDKTKVIREVTHTEATWDDLRKMGKPLDPASYATPEAVGRQIQPKSQVYQKIELERPPKPDIISAFFS
mmetsp:Transcript_8154/g.30078  ORF Transcript_8154/g.30078 Transcript_8154/m.30078 type:complete len:294 (-) Transcript_8154:1321-2202(-)